MGLLFIDHRAKFAVGVLASEWQVFVEAFVEMECVIHSLCNHERASFSDAWGCFIVAEYVIAFKLPRTLIHVVVISNLAIS